MKKKARRTKAKKVHYIGAGYHVVTPYLSVRGAAKAIDFYRKAFGAKEVMRMPEPDGKVGHAEIAIGGDRIMMSDEYPDMQFTGPQTRGGTTVHLMVYVKDVDAVVARAVAAGAKVVQEIEDKFYGDRSGSLEDPFGHVWHFATHKEDLSKAQLRKRAEQAAKD